MRNCSFVVAGSPVFVLLHQVFFVVGASVGEVNSSEGGEVVPSHVSKLFSKCISLYDRFMPCEKGFFFSFTVFLYVTSCRIPKYRA